jgi:threonine dehydrogenase-like Zn-dependent dehydrogenase
MKAVVFHGPGDIRLDDVPEPELECPTDAIVHITTSAICGTDLHFVRGTMPGIEPGTVLGHEGVGIVEEVGAGVRNVVPGDRVVIPSTIACGTCSYCREGYTAQCDRANPNGPLSGTAFYGGPQDSGPFQGLQAERARIPFAQFNLVKLPDEVTDEQAILISDVFPTGWFGAELCGVRPGRTVAVFGCGPVGLMAIASARMMKAGRIFAVDRISSRLAEARALGAETIDFTEDDPVETIRELTDGIGTDRAIDAVGCDAESPDDDEPGSAPSQALDWGVDALAKAGTLGVIGVYPPGFRGFPFGRAMGRNVSLRMGNCHHRRYVPELVELVRAGHIDPSKILSQFEPINDALDAYRAFDERRAGWIKVGIAA